MGEEAEKETETRKSGRFWSFPAWIAVVLAIYFLSSGPVIGMVDNMISRKSTTAKYLGLIYAPLEWAYYRTALHRPLGMYWHLWSARFDRNGDMK